MTRALNSTPAEDAKGRRLLLGGKHYRFQILPQDLLQAVRRERAIDDDAEIPCVEHDEPRPRRAHGIADGFARLPLVQDDLDTVVAQVRPAWRTCASIRRCRGRPS